MSQPIMHSEVRKSSIMSLLDKVKNKNYGQYLRIVYLNKVRGFSNVEVNFDFPVTALIGPNGGGKSTVLGAAACAYREIKPGQFFPKSVVGDNSMADWTIEYDLIEKEIAPTSLVRRKTVFKRLKWDRTDLISRPLSYFGISRTVSAGERPEFKKLRKQNSDNKFPLESLPEQLAQEIGYILGRSVSDFKRTSFIPDARYLEDGRYTFHVGNLHGIEYSEFHFGAGESSILRIVSSIEEMPESSLILIEEIENGLHPIATRRLVEYLIMAAVRKKIQVIFTTHSDEALAPLPSDAVWACFDGQVQQGKLSISALRAISGKVDKALAVFVEDKFAQRIMTAIVQIFLSDVYDQIEVHYLAGDGNAIKVHNNRLNDPTARYASLCVLDGDSKNEANIDAGIFKLPGEQPEYEVFSKVLANIDVNIALLTAYLQLDISKQGLVKNQVLAISATCRDPHNIFNQIGLKLGFIPEDIVAFAFIKLWIHENEDCFKELVERIKVEVEKYGNKHTT